MNIKEQIRAEIERLCEIDYPCDTNEQAIGFYDALDRIEDFLDTLPEQPVEGLEEAAEAHTFFAANQPGQEWETHDVTDAFKAGAEWMKSKYEK